MDDGKPSVALRIGSPELILDYEGGRFTPHAAGNRFSFPVFGGRRIVGDYRVISGAPHHFVLAFFAIMTTLPSASRTVRGRLPWDTRSSVECHLRETVATSHRFANVLGVANMLY